MADPFTIDDQANGDVPDFDIVLDFEAAHFLVHTVPAFTLSNQLFQP